jgi:hypothetical protein
MFIAKTCRGAPIDLAHSLLKLGVLAGLGEYSISIFNGVQKKLLLDSIYKTYPKAYELNYNISGVVILIRMLIYLQPIMAAVKIAIFLLMQILCACSCIGGEVDREEKSPWENSEYWDKYYCPYRQSWISHGYEKYYMIDNRIDDYMKIEDIDEIIGIP